MILSRETAPGGREPQAGWVAYKLGGHLGTRDVHRVAGVSTLRGPLAPLTNHRLPDGVRTNILSVVYTSATDSIHVAIIVVMQLERDWRINRAGAKTCERSMWVRTNRTRVLCELLPDWVMC